ncbi:MAG: phasin family protein [Pseudomonadota bacterium]
MTKAKATEASVASMVPQFDLEPLIAASQRSLKAATEAQDHALRRMTKLNSEIYRFINRRLDQDRDMVKELATCKTPMDAAGVCGKFMENAVKQYSEEMGLMAGIYADQAREAVEDVQHQVEQTVDANATSGKALTE